MKLEKLDTRLEALLADPSNLQAVDRILRMIGDELPRYRKEILDGARARLSAAASALLVRKDDPHSASAAFQLLSAATVITAYQAAAAERHCAECENPLVDHFVLEVGEGSVPGFRFCGDCIDGAIARVRPDAARVFLAAYELKTAMKEETETFHLFIGRSEDDPGKPSIRVVRATHRRPK